MSALVLSQVMRNGELVQCGKYNDLLEAGTDFGAFATAQNEAKELAEIKSKRDLALVVVDPSANLLAKKASENGELLKSISNEKFLDKTAMVGR